MCYLLLLLSLYKLLLAASSFSFVELQMKWIFTKGKYPSDDSPLGKPEGIFLKIYSRSDLAPKAFDVSGVNMIQASQEQDVAIPMHLVICLKESQKFGTILQICIFWRECY